MRSLRRVVTFLLVVLLMAALVAPGALAKQPNKQVPLKGDFAGVGPDFSGNFSHLGRFEGVLDQATFTAVWTAANGDAVTNQTIAFETIEEVAPGVFTYEQTIVITGGTGRFTDATGNVSVTGTIDFNTGAYDGRLVDSTISQPGPRNR